MQYVDVIPHEWQKYAAIFAALGDGSRQRILLFFDPGERLTIKQLVDAFPLSRTGVLHHVRVLQAAGLLDSVKVGREVLLTVNKTALLEALHITSQYAEQAL